MTPPQRFGWGHDPPPPPTQPLQRSPRDQHKSERRNNQIGARALLRRIYVISCIALESLATAGVVDPLASVSHLLVSKSECQHTRCAISGRNTADQFGVLPSMVIISS